MATNILLKRSSTASKRPVAGSMSYGELNLNYDAATGGVYYKDSADNVVKVGPCQVSATAPNASPAGSAGNSAGEFWFDSSSQTLKVYDGATWVETGGAVQGVSATAPITVDNTDPLNPIIGIDAASTIQSGAVQLNDSTSSTSTTEAATANAVKTAYDLADGKVSGVTANGPVTVDNTDPKNPVVGIDSASTAQEGAVQLTDSTSSTSTTTAATPNSVKSAYDLADAALPKTAFTAAGDLISGTGSGTYTALPVGTNGQVLTVDTACAGKLKWTACTGVTSVTAGTGLTGGTITTTGTIALATSGVGPGSYTYSNITVDTYGRVTFASNGPDPLSLTGGTMTGAIVFDISQIFPVGGIADATTASKGVVRIGSNIDVTAGVISIANASTSTLGVVQLNDTTNSTSTSLALTAAQGKNLQDQIDALAVTSNLTLAGTFNASTGLVDSVTTAGTAAGFSVGSALPAPAAGNTDYFVIIDVEGSTGPSGTPPYHVGDWYLSDGTVWQFLNVGFQPGQATTLSQGTVQLATDAEVQAGTDPSNAVVSSSLQSKLSDSTSTTSSTTIASSTAVKSAYDLANAALPKAGGTMTGNITFQDSGEGVVFNGGSSVYAISDSTSTTSSTTAASTTAVKSAYDLADAAVPDATFLAAGDLLVGSGAGTYAALSAGPSDYILSSDGAGGLVWVTQSEGDVTTVSGTAPITVDNTDPQNPVVGVDAASTSAVGVVQLNDTVTSTSIVEAATANAVKIAYDAALLSGITSATTIYVNNTNGNDSTGERGTTKAFLTINAALAVALNDDTIFLSPGTFTENVTLTKGVTLIGTWQDSSLSDGTTIVGNFVSDMVTPVATSAPSINHIRFVSTNTTSAFTVLNNSQTSGTTVISDCSFTLAGSTTEFCFETVGTWTSSLYMRRPTFDGNIKHAAGTAAGASGYLVLDGILATGSASRHYAISTGTVEFRRPSNALSPVLQTGGVVLFTDCIAGLTPSNATTSPVFGGTGISYKGAAASPGTGTVYFNGYTPITGVVNIGANMIYGWSGLNVTPANLIISGSAVAYTTAVPAAADVVTASQQRPRFDLLTATSSVAATNQLATVIDSATGTFYTVTSLDAGVY